MTTIQREIDKALDANELKALCAQAGPCVTIQAPAYRPGDGAGSNAVRIRQLVRSAEEAAINHKLGESAAPLLESLHDLVDRTDWEAGGKGRVLFSLPGFAVSYRLDLPGGQHMVLAGRPYLKPVLAEALAPRELFLLGLNKKGLRLLRYRRSVCEETPLPPGTPATLLEAAGTDQPDHRLTNRTASGVSTGTMHAVQFGTLDQRETEPKYIHDFMAMVDQGLQPLLNGAPLVLMGVAEHIAAYRRAARYPNILETQFEGTPDLVTLDQAAANAQAAALAHFRREGEGVLHEFLEMKERHRTTNKVGEAMAAAEEGRVHQLVLAEEASIATEEPSHRRQLLAGEDLLNAIAVETIRKGGSVYTLPAERMGDVAPLAAILRY